MATLELKLSDLYTRVSTFLGFTTVETAPTGTVLTQCKNIVYRGYRNFLYPIDSRTGDLHNWSFLKQLHVLKTQTGKWKYNLPVNFSDFLDKPHFDDSTGYNELTRIAPEQILELRTTSVSERPLAYYAIAPFTYDNDTGTFYEMWLDPEPDGEYILKFFYRIDPLKPENATDYLVGGMRASEAILENCLAIAEQQEDDNAGLHTQLAEQLTQKLIRCDIEEDSDFIGNLTQNYSNKYRNWKTINTDLVYEDEGGVG